MSKTLILTISLLILSLKSFSQTQVQSVLQSPYIVFFNSEIDSLQRNVLKDKIDSLSKKIENGDTSSSIYYSRVIVLQEIGLHNLAILDFNKSSLLDPENSNVYLMRGISKSRFFITHDACLDFKKAYELGLAEANNIMKKRCSKYGLVQTVE